jgi:HlyD family secretion protein
MSRTLRRSLLWGVLLLIVIAGLAIAFWPRALSVDLAATVAAPLQVTINEEGETRVKDVYLVSAPLAGRSLRTALDVGDNVLAGRTVVARIHPQDPTLLDLRSQRAAEAEVKAAEAALALANAELDRARAEQRFAQSEYARVSRLFERGTAAERTLDSARLEVSTKRAAVASAQAAIEVKGFDLETAKARLISPDLARNENDSRCCVEVLAPVSGSVLNIFQESETVVAAGAPLLEIGNPGQLEVVAELLSSDAVQVEKGAPVLIEDWGGGMTLSGRIQRIEPYGFTKVSALGIEEQRVKVVIDFLDPPEAWQRLGHGYRVEVRVVTWQNDSVLQVPISALFRDGTDWAVFVADEGQARLRHVELGHLNDEAAEVLAGLTEGEWLVLHPSDQVSDGKRIVSRKN